LQMSGSM
jgi:hypothetical protein